MTTRFARFRVLAACAAVLALAPLGALADGPSPSPQASYNDLGMHFDAPAGYESVPVSPTDPTGSDESGDATPVAAFVYHREKSDQRIITIKVARFDGTVRDFASTHTSDLRKNDNVFVVKNEPMTLANGMPAYFLKVNSGNEAGHYGETFEYLVCDGVRSIDVALFGSQGTFDDATARTALASLYVVAYPRRRK